MSIDVSAPAKGLVDTLNPGGSWNTTTWERSGGTFVGNLAAVTCFQPVVPYMGPAPLLLVSSVPVQVQVGWEGAGSHKMMGVLEAFYLGRTSEETGLSLAQIDAQMADDCTAIVAAVLGDHTLAGSVVSVTAPIEIARDPRGLFMEWEGSPWVYCSLRFPFIGAPSSP